ncbi:MAG: hypothetical protein FWC87_06830 [Acidimicrobiaceae bacterium]|nr:hypothetical protein [Acidimicrobiaceae bacterium]
MSSVYRYDPAEKYDEGFDYNELDTLTEEEVNAELARAWTSRGPLYQVFSNALMLDYGGPSFAKRHSWASGTFGTPRGQEPDRANGILYSTHTLTSYVMLGWETGIRNQFHVLRLRGMSKEQSMEVVFFTMHYAGMRGLGHTYRAVGDFLPQIAPPPRELPLAEGWVADPEAFKCGLDLTTRRMTPADVENLTNWYEETIGYLPESIRFGIKLHPEFVKANRAKWEVAIRTLPKQFAPWIMIRQNMMSGNVDGLREAVLLGKAWGISRHHIANGIANSCCFFTGFEGFHIAQKAMEDIWDAWDE